MNGDALGGAWGHGATPICLFRRQVQGIEHGGVLVQESLAKGEDLARGLGHLVDKGFQRKAVLQLPTERQNQTGTRVRFKWCSMLTLAMS